MGFTCGQRLGVTFVNQFGVTCGIYKKLGVTLGNNWGLPVVYRKLVVTFGNQVGATCGIQEIGSYRWYETASYLWYIRNWELPLAIHWNCLCYESQTRRLHVCQHNNPSLYELGWPRIAFLLVRRFLRHLELLRLKVSSSVFLILQRICRRWNFRNPSWFRKNTM